MMTELVNEIINKSFEEVSASSLILKMLDCYSKLYLNGKQPSTCGRCHRDYYITLKKNGMELAKKYEEAKNRTCKPAWTGLKYIPATARHWDDNLLTDKEAEYLLEKHFLKESDFEVLPSSEIKDEVLPSLEIKKNKKKSPKATLNAK